MPLSKPPKKFRGKIYVVHDKWTADFWLGKKSFDKNPPDWEMGNVSVAYAVINLLEMLGHTVVIEDNADLDEDD